ncbi:PIN domain-containing protein [Thiocapsa rosea]
MKYLLDTNVVSEPIRARPSVSVLSGIEAHATELAVSAISWQEMHYGLERLPPGARRDRIRAYLEERVHPTPPCPSYPSTRRPANGRRANEHVWKRSGARLPTPTARSRPSPPSMGWFSSPATPRTSRTSPASSSRTGSIRKRNRGLSDGPLRLLEAQRLTRAAAIGPVLEPNKGRAQLNPAEGGESK